MLILLLSKIADKIQLLDFPNDRKRHGIPIPLVGGLGIYCTLITCFAFFSFSSNAVVWTISAGFIVILGVIDDLIDLDFKIKLLAQVLIAAVTTSVADLQFNNLGFMNDNIDKFLGLFGPFLAIVFIVGIMNAFNMVDGVDGLATVHFLTAVSQMVVVLSLSNESFGEHQFWIIMLSSAFAFLLVNLSVFSLRKIFLGDSGALLLGYILACGLIFYSQEKSSRLSLISALFLCALPVYDTFWLIIRRLKNGSSPFVAGRDHLHHLLMDIGFSKSLVLVLIIICSAFLSFVGNALVYLVSNEAGLAAYIFSLFIYGYIITSLSSRSER